MSAINNYQNRGPLPDLKDLEHCNTAATTMGVYSSLGTLAFSLASRNPFATWTSLAALAGSLFGHHSAREATEKNELRMTTYSLIDVVTEKNDQIKTKDKIIQDQQGEIERLTAINAELEEKVKRLEQTQKSFDELNEEHIKILEEQTKQIEEKRDILSKLTGLVEGYETRKAKHVEEMRETRQQREALQSDIKALLAEQKKINENLAERVHGLGEVASRVDQGVKD
ncbi:MAG: hypothetical protein H6620_08260 [Halobacteriovoraceae bacterium]|nr:hypothetical protein [Halobacteriovoraceae bacterium]